MALTKNFVVSALLAVAGAIGSFSQSNLNQRITGDVVDPSGAAQPNANITIMEVGTGLTRKTTSNAAGNYTFPDLPAGKYRVTCEAPGCKQQVIDNNSLNTNLSIEVNCKLQIGSQSDSVTIQADAAVVETTNGDLGFTVTGEEASELQLNGRNFPELLQLLPGVSTTYTDGFGLFSGYGVNNSGQSINGGRTDTTTWNLDGFDNKDNGGGNSFVNVNPDATGEFRVLTSNFSAETGTSSGAVINIAIRSGTKDFHGKLFDRAGSTKPAFDAVLQQERAFAEPARSQPRGAFMAAPAPTRPTGIVVSQVIDGPKGVREPICQRLFPAPGRNIISSFQ